jgi:hypothetical protein
MGGDLKCLKQFGRLITCTGFAITTSADITTLDREIDIWIKSEEKNRNYLEIRVEKTRK